jgi:hypothetical protein
MIYRLIILNGDRRGEHITVTEEPMTIGRGTACDVRIIDPEMAQTHAEVTHRPNGPAISDLGSMNRLLVNNHEVRQATLKHGDIVELGRTRFLVQAYVQAEVAAGDGLAPLWRRWALIAGAAAVILLVIVAPVLYWHRRPAPAVPPTLPRPPAARVTLSPASIPAPLAPAVESNLTPATEAEMAAATAATVRAEGTTLAEQERELNSAVDALAESKARTMLVDVKDKLGSGDAEGAERLLTEVLWLRPDYGPALELRARLLEQRGRAAEARKQWNTLTASTNTELAAAAREEVRRLDAAHAPEPVSVTEPPPARVATPAPTVASAPVPAPAVIPEPVAVPVVTPEPVPVPTVIAAPSPAPATPLVPAQRVRIGQAEISKFPSTDAFREMRLLSIHLAAATAESLPDTGTVTVEVLFYERDGATGAVTAAPERGPRKPLPVEGSWREGEDKVVSASYAVQASESAVRARQFHGYRVRVFHHGILQDVVAQPQDLLTAPGDSGEPADRAGAP